jgi:hypothetical protein
MRALIRLVAFELIAIVAITLLPGLAELRERFAHTNPVWISTVAFKCLPIVGPTSE